MHLPPVGHGVRLIGRSGCVDKILILAQAHLGLLRIGGAGKEREHPAEITGSGALHHGLLVGATAPLELLGACRRQRRESARIGRGINRDAYVGLFGNKLLKR